MIVDTQHTQLTAPHCSLVHSETVHASVSQRVFSSTPVSGQRLEVSPDRSEEGSNAAWDARGTRARGLSRPQSAPAGESRRLTHDL
jgi:hypothetical protein